MAENVILAETTYEGFANGQILVSPAPFVLTEGETYRVVWDGVEHETVCILLDGIPTITDADDLENPTNATFAFMYLSAEAMESDTDGVGLNAYDFSSGSVAFDTNTSHTVAIYQVVEDEEPEEPEEPAVQEGIVLKDRNGNDVKYYGIETVTFDTTTEGKQQTYTKGVAVEGLEIVPDFSGGDMAVSAGEGILVKSATIKKPDALFPDNIRNGVDIGGVAGTFIGDTEEQTVALSMADGDMVIEPSAVGKVLSQVMVQKPETLVPENIAEGIDIAGVIGTLVAGGTSKVAFGTFSSSSTSSTTITISHNLGVVPDFVIVFARYVPSTKTGYFCNIGFSNAFVSKFMSGVSSPRYRLSYQKTSSGISIMYDTSVGIETTDSSIYINNANEASFQSGSLVASSDYYWVAIGGLT